MRRGLLICAALISVVAFLPAAISQAEPPATPTVTLAGAGSFLGANGPNDLTVPVAEEGPESRVQAWIPRPPGTKEWITLDYGPYLIHPGSDLTRMDVEVVGATGYATGFIPSVVDVNGVEQPSHEIHIHHAHWFWLDPEMEGYHRWIYGTGEERTQGSILPAAKADSRFKNGLRYGVPLTAGDRLAFLSMLHNKTSQPKVVYLRVRIEYVFGTDEQLRKDEDLDFHPLTPVLIGSTFNVPRTGGTFVYPLDVTKDTIGQHTNYHNPVPDAEVVPGVGQVVTIPWDGTVIIGAGHSHPGAREVVLSNMGSKEDPCPEDGDRYPGTTIARSRNITRGGVFPSEEFQMGLTQPGWRVHVRAGDRLALNGVYDATNFAYPDAMSYFGMYLDRAESSPAKACAAELVDRPGASAAEVVWTIPNQEWPEEHAMATCDRCDERAPKPEPGAETNLVHIAGFQYLPGNLGFSGSPLGPPVVKRGEVLRFVNEDFAEALVRHSVTSCRAPCNGPYVANYPFHDGRFHSGAMGWMWQETYVSARDEPRWELDTSDLKKGYYTYYCQLHAWMRGGFYVR